jgi:hypothetical protein
VFTLAGAPGTCSSANVAGVYAVGVPLAASNTVTLNVNVMTAGTYNVTAGPFQGMTFTGTGSIAVGAQTIVLIGTAASIPTTAGANTVPVNAGGTNCSFVVTVVSPAVYTINCPGVVVNGTYQVGTALGASNFITIPITVTTAGPYSITASINGMTFANSGTLTLATTSITLNGSGTPTTAVGSPFNLSVGTPACLIPITCTAAPATNWRFTVVGGATYQGTSSTVPGDIEYNTTILPPASFLFYIGFNVALDQFDLDLLDLTGGITATETYNTNSIGLTNAADFYFSDFAGTIDLQADQGQTAPPANITYTITSHSTITKTIIGTFSGTAFDTISGTIKTITTGTFTIVYP